MAIRIEQPLQMPLEGELRIIQDVPADPIERLLPGLERNSQIATLFSVVLVEAARKFGAIGGNDLQALFMEMAQNCCRMGIPEEEGKRLRLGV